MRVLSSFQDRLRQAGYTLVAANAGYDLEDELREATFLLERGVDGLMLVGDIHHPDLHARIARAGIPMVQTFSLSRERPCVGFDNAASAARAANYLMDLGHRRIGVISGLRKDNDRGGARARERDGEQAGAPGEDRAAFRQGPHGQGPHGVARPPFSVTR